jgi:hypothetical protein
MSVKEQILQAVQCLPEDIDFWDVTDEIALLAAIKEAERDIERGEDVSNENENAHREMGRVIRRRPVSVCSRQGCCNLTFTRRRIR